MLSARHVSIEKRCDAGKGCARLLQTVTLLREQPVGDCERDRDNELVLAGTAPSRHELVAQRPPRPADFDDRLVGEGAYLEDGIANPASSGSAMRANVSTRPAPGFSRRKALASSREEKVAATIEPKGPMRSSEPPRRIDVHRRSRPWDHRQEPRYQGHRKLRQPSGPQGSIFPAQGALRAAARLPRIQARELPRTAALVLPHEPPSRYLRLPEAQVRGRP